jgi:SecD/SecF fusion protein
MKTKAKNWVERNYPTATAESKTDLIDQRLRRLLDSTKTNKIGLFGTTYRDAKDKELALGLDLQGGMSVTMEVSMDGLIRSLADYTKDAAFNKALDAAVAKKANSGADLVSLFVDEYKSANANNKLANFFINKSTGKIKFSSSEGEVANYLKEKSEDAFKNTTNIIRS